ncbi:MAG: helix-turn-helix domain-containing protein [Cetobacterium sp.]
MKGYISVAQAAKKLNVSVQTIYRMCREGVLGGSCMRRLNNKKWMIDPKTIDLLVEESKFKSDIEIRNQQTLF